MEDNDQPIITEINEWNDDEWGDNIEEMPIDNKPITVEQMKDVIEETKRIMIFFIKNNFGEDIHARATELLNSINIDIDSDEKTAEACAAYCSSENYRSIIHSYAKRIIFEKLS